ncbi:MAG: ATPase, T2SS/T4P/T4SS family [Candidatus Eisenbacteria bacterium]|nr:ATPase, T2SS/T4P/T4SS family [Candidatus Eisenbacteria bacterium]
MATTRSKSLGAFLLGKGMLTVEKLERAIEEQKRSRTSLRESMLKLGFVKEEDILSFYEHELGIPRVELTTYLIDPQMLRLIPAQMARKHKIIPLFKAGNTLSIAISDPLDVVGIDEARRVSQCNIEVNIVKESDLLKFLEEYYPEGGLIEEIDREPVEEVSKDETVLDEMRAVRLLDALLIQATHEMASDVHVEPEERFLRVRFRVDGFLKEVARQPKEVHPPLVSRIKILSDLDISERRTPQDGHFKAHIEGKEIDFRVSTFPTVHGENVVLRILDRATILLKLEDLGLSASDEVRLRSMISRPDGILLVTGPTGSGKTTTLYACLNALNTIDRNIQTLEDPVEYKLPLMRQTQVDSDFGVGFADGLRSILRQDPDIIMVGEIRDRETEEIAIRSAMTGHFVLSTLHTNDAPGAISRLLDMGAEPFLLASTLVGSIAQRLVRKICERCKEPYVPEDRILQRIGFPTGTEFYRGKGCVACAGTGLKGRIGIFEVLMVSEEIKASIRRGESIDNITSVAVSLGMTSLRADGINKALAGTTTIEEVLRLTKGRYTAREDSVDRAISALES